MKKKTSCISRKSNYFFFSGCPDLSSLHLNIVPSTSGSSKCSRNFSLTDCIFMTIFNSVHACYMPCPSRPPLFIYSWLTDEANSRMVGLLRAFEIDNWAENCSILFSPTQYCISTKGHAGTSLERKNKTKLPPPPPPLLEGLVMDGVAVCRTHPNMASHRRTGLSLLPSTTAALRLPFRHQSWGRPSHWTYAYGSNNQTNNLGI